MAYYRKAINIDHDLSLKRIQRGKEDVKAIIDDINKNFTSPYPMMFYQWRKQPGCLEYLHRRSTSETDNCLLRTYQETKTVDLQHAKEIGETEKSR